MKFALVFPLIYIIFSIVGCSEPRTRIEDDKAFLKEGLTTTEIGQKMGSPDAYKFEKQPDGSLGQTWIYTYSNPDATGDQPKKKHLYLYFNPHNLLTKWEQK